MPLYWQAIPAPHTMADQTGAVAICWKKLAELPNGFVGFPSKAAFSPPAPLIVPIAVTGLIRPAPETDVTCPQVQIAPVAFSAQAVEVPG